MSGEGKNEAHNSKFGGTSVATDENRTLRWKDYQCEGAGLFPVVVVSAIGRKGEPYATDTLIQFANRMGK